MWSFCVVSWCLLHVQASLSIQTPTLESDSYGPNVCSCVRWHSSPFDLLSGHLHQTSWTLFEVHRYSYIHTRVRLLHANNSWTQHLHRQTPRSNKDTDKQIGGTRLKPKEHVSGIYTITETPRGKDTSALSVSQRFLTFSCNSFSPLLRFYWSHIHKILWRVLEMFI